jgi:hypothetical protein
MELDEGLVHRDAINAHQERPDSVLRHPNPAILGATWTFGQWWWSGYLRDQEVGGTFDCHVGHVVRHTIDDSRGSDDKISKPESASR